MAKVQYIELWNRKTRRLVQNAGWQSC